MFPVSSLQETIYGSKSQIITSDETCPGLNLVKAEVPHLPYKTETSHLHSEALSSLKALLSTCHLVNLIL